MMIGAYPNFSLCGCLDILISSFLCDSYSLVLRLTKSEFHDNLCWIDYAGEIIDEKRNDGIECRSTRPTFWPLEQQKLTWPKEEKKTLRNVMCLPYCRHPSACIDPPNA